MQNVNWKAPVRVHISANSSTQTDVHTQWRTDRPIS